MRIIAILIFSSFSCYSQTNLQFGKVNGNSVSNCQDSIDGKICQSDRQLEVWLTKTIFLIGQEESIELSFDGTNWKALKYSKNLITNKADTIKLQPLYNNDTVFSALKKNKIFLLPNQDELKLVGSVDDGCDYALTFKAGDKFRTYHFSNPDLYQGNNKAIPELENYINIIDILFGWFKKE